MRFHKSDFMGHAIPTWVPDNLWAALLGSLTLTLQPEYLDILPLYVVLLVAVPLFMLLEQIHRGTGLLLSIALWLTAEIAGLNFPSSRSSAGWYFDPFAWQILFCLGLIAGSSMLASGNKITRSSWLSALAAGYLLVAFAVVTPCRFRGLAGMCYLTPGEFDWCVPFYRLGELVTSWPPHT